MIGNRLILFLQRAAFGNSQWAFSGGLESKDLNAMLMMSWILAVWSAKNIGAYLSNIIFDRACKIYFSAKLRAAVMGSKELNRSLLKSKIQCSRAPSWALSSAFFLLL